MKNEEKRGYPLEGIYFCSHCHGDGIVEIYNPDQGEIQIRCPICKGSGIVDWIENITKR